MYSLWIKTNPKPDYTEPKMYLQLNKDGINYQVFPYVELNQKEINLIESIWNKSDYNYENEPIGSIYLEKDQLKVITGQYYGGNILRVPFINRNIAEKIVKENYSEILELFKKISA